MLTPGFATAEGTARFRARHESRLPGHFRQANGLWISTIGLGTYLGEPTPAFDERYTEAVTRAVALGTNHFDSAINYRHQRSERSIAAALRNMFEAGTLRRDEIVVATKGGFLTFDGEEPPDPAAFFHEKLIATGLVRPEEVAAGCHVMSPKYLAYQIDQSRKNLGLETIDIYYIHNPETQLGEITEIEFQRNRQVRLGEIRETFYRRLRLAFDSLEKAVSDGKICCYGTATWNAYQVKPQSAGTQFSRLPVVGVQPKDSSLSLREVLRAAEEAGGKDHHFRAVQLPFNLAMPEALAAQTQSWDDRPASFLELARAHHLMVFASASIMQGHLAQGLPADIRRSFPGLSTDAQCALQFVRSAPGITCALVGMSRREHVEENLATARVAPFTTEDFRRLFAR